MLGSQRMQAPWPTIAGDGPVVLSAFKIKPATRLTGTVIEAYAQNSLIWPIWFCGVRGPPFSLQFSIAGACAIRRGMSPYSKPGMNSDADHGCTGSFGDRSGSDRQDRLSRQPLIQPAARKR